MDRTAPTQQVALDPSDPVGFTTALDEEERQVQATVRRFVSERFLPAVGTAFEEGSFDLSIAEELGRMGLLGMHLKGYGCAGTSAVSYGLACAELEAGDSGLRSFASVQGSLAMFAIYRYGSEEQREHYLPLMARGQLIGCFALTESDSGSDPASMRTTAKRDGDDWVINGSKMWITSGSVAHVAIVWARTEDGVRGFLVDRDTPGFVARDIPHKMSLRASITSELLFEECRVPASAQLPDAAGLRAPLSCLNEARFGILWGVTGAARACYESALAYAGDREQFGRPISGFQLTQRKLSDMAIQLGGAQLLALHLGRRKDREGLAAEHVSMGKAANCRVASDIARVARSVLGANGISLEYPVIRHMLNLESVATYEGTDEIHTLSIGRAITGLNAFS